MAVFKSVKGVGKNPSSLGSVLDYVGNERKDEGVYKTTGLNCSNNPQEAFKEMMLTKDIHDNLQGRQYRHHIQSFKPDEITPEEAHKLAVEFAKENYKGFEVYIATHQDKNHIHNHYVINSVSLDSGLKFRELNKDEIQEKKEKNIELRPHEFTLDNLKNSSDDFCRQYNLSVIDRTKPKSLNIYDKKHYQAITKNKGKESYKTTLAITVKKMVETAKNKVDFIQKMKEKGVNVIWEKSKKHITFKFDDENKKAIRLSNLAKTYKDPIFEKENFINAIENKKVRDYSVKYVSTKEEKREILTEEQKQEKINKIKNSIEQKESKRQQELKIKQEKEQVKKREEYRGIGI